METVLDAIRAGKEHLTVYCKHCRLIVEVPWVRAPTLRLGDKVEDIHHRLVCRRCGVRPERVVAEKRKVPSGPTYGPGHGGR